MRRIAGILLLLALVVAACGSGDDTGGEGDASGDTSVVASEDTGSTDDDTSTGDAEAGASSEPEAEQGEPAEPDEPTDDTDGGSISISGIDDIPQVCRDLMAQFLTDIEPMVSPIDWETATLNDFEAIAPEFDQLATDFDAATEAEAECNDIDLDDDENFQLIIEFAGQVAPGTVGFMTFISELANATGAVLAEDDAQEDMGGGTGEDAFDDCDGAVAWLQGLMDEHESMASVPMAEMMQFADLGSFITTCTPEQLEFFDSAEVQEFMSGL